MDELNSHVGIHPWPLRFCVYSGTKVSRSSWHWRVEDTLCLRSMYSNDPPKSDVPSYSVHADRSMHETYSTPLQRIKVLQSLASTTDTLYLWKKILDCAKLFYCYPPLNFFPCLAIYGVPIQLKIMPEVGSLKWLYNMHCASEPPERLCFPFSAVFTIRDLLLKQIKHKSIYFWVV